METLIHWREWSAAAFGEARETDRPVLLAIGAVWCHWCHVMDQTTYGDPEVARLVHEHLIPIRVDNDRRPDINRRYNMGGWPTTAFLTPEGEILTGATYLPPEHMRQVIERVVHAWRHDRARLQEALAERRQRRTARLAGAGDPVVPTDDEGVERGEGARRWEGVLRAVLDDARGRYDAVFGGFGRQPKFPMPGLLALLLDLLAWPVPLAVDRRAVAGMLEKTLLAMAEGGMYDREAGGFFRYSTTRDWSVPHFEKMLEDHAGLLPVYARAAQVLPAADVGARLQRAVDSAWRYLTDTLWDGARGGFAGSQDADEAYYALTLAERAGREAPFVDRTFYVDWNARMALACFELAASGQFAPDPRRAALRILERIAGEMREPSGLYRHDQPSRSDAEPSQAGLLGDQAWVLRAMVRAWQEDPTGPWRQHALDAARTLLEAFGDREGKLMDRARSMEAEVSGLLAEPMHPLDENAVAALGLIELAAVLDAAEPGAESPFRAIAEAILAGLAKEARAHGVFAADIAGALMRLENEPVRVVIVAREGDAAALRRAAFEPPAAWRVVVTLDPDRDRQAIAAGGYPPSDAPAAYVCIGQTCSAPATTPESLRAGLAQAEGS